MGKTACGECTKTKDHPAGWLECDGCSQWFHADCQGLTNDQRKTIGELGPLGVKWYCETNRCREVDHTKDAIQDLKQDLTRQIKALDSSIKELSKKTTINEPNWAQAAADVTGKLETQMKTHINVIKQAEERVREEKKSEEQQREKEKREQEKKEAESRAKNMVVFGIPEADDEGETTEEEHERIQRYMNDQGLHMMIKLGTYRRMGRRDPDNPRVRPLLLEFNSAQQKWDALKRINGMKVRGFFARLHLTKEELRKDFELRKELRERNAESQGVVYKIVNKKVVKITEHGKRSQSADRGTAVSGSSCGTVTE